MYSYLSNSFFCQNILRKIVTWVYKTSFSYCISFSCKWFLCTVNSSMFSTYAHSNGMVIIDGCVVLWLHECRWPIYSRITTGWGVLCCGLKLCVCITHWSITYPLTYLPATKIRIVFQIELLASVVSFYFSFVPSHMSMGTFSISEILVFQSSILLNNILCYSMEWKTEKPDDFRSNEI